MKKKYFYIYDWLLSLTKRRIYQYSCHPRVGCPSKQPKLEPKLVSALSKTPKQNICFGCFASYTEKESFWCFDWTETNCLIESIFWYFFRKCKVVSVCFGFFRNSLFQLFRFCTKTESFNVSIKPKQKEDQLYQFDTAHILLFFRKFRVVLFCFETVLFV